MQCSGQYCKFHFLGCKLLLCLRAFSFAFIFSPLVLSSVGASEPIHSENVNDLKQNADLIDKPVKLESADRNRIVLATTVIGVAGITAWGVVQWDYFSRAPHAQSEGWFGQDTDDGGMDKLGHLYASYIMSHGFSCLYEHWNFERDDAALCGALTSFTIMGHMEFSDSFSDYGFSGEDMTMNTLGCLVGYLLYLHPEWSSKIDFRWQFGLDPTKSDFTTDYGNSKFLFAVKLNGFESCRENWLRHIELHAGYYAEGFDDPSEHNDRHPYVGVGFNFTDLFRRQGYNKTAKVFNYVQVPYTAINYDFDR